MNGVYFRDGRFHIEKSHANVNKSAEGEAVLRLLRSFLDANEPGLVRLLVNTWQAQGKAITYKTLREAILSGELDPELLDEWQQDYSRFVKNYLQPEWEKAMKAAVKSLEDRFTTWLFDPYKDGVQTWLSTRAASFVTNCTTTQIEGLRAVVQRAVLLEGRNVDDLARVIRPMVGLTRQASVANLNYYKNLLDGGMKPERAKDLSIRYSARQHRSRAYTIARSELSSAYGTGAHEGTKQAIEAGYMKNVYKVWSTALDERVCPICGYLEGKRIPMDEDIYYEKKDRYGNTIRRRINHTLNDPDAGKHPPGHVSCRCCVVYVEQKRSRD